MATIVEGNLKAPFSIATTVRCRRGSYSFSWIAPLTLDLYHIIMRVKQWGIKYHFFESLVWLNLGLNPNLLDHWWTLYSVSQWAGEGVDEYICMCVYIYVYIFSFIYIYIYCKIFIIDCEVYFPALF